ncbi:MAG: hypothetical protein JXX14_16245 [Deltaproteobacteria bacterium]|nr:hypothetical protein [Deltaproteobacteria bacterium]
MNESAAETVMFKDLDLENLPRLQRLKDRYFGTPKEVCIERAHYVTEYLRDHAVRGDSPILRYAKAVHHFLKNKTPLFLDDSLLPGTTTSKYFGAPVYPELTGMLIWPELDTIGTRKDNPMQLSKTDAAALAHDIFPYWMERNILERARSEFKEPSRLKLFEKLVFFIASKPGAVSHTVPFYEKMLDSGLEGIIAEARARQDALGAKDSLNAEQKDQSDFYEAVQIAMDGILLYADNLSREARRLADTEKNADQKQNLLMMAEICQKVPRKPAATFREAVTVIWIGQIAVHAENINMAISPGRVDQLLVRYYENDIATGSLTRKDALDLAGCLWLKLNDNTNLVPLAGEKLFGGAGSVPAVTLGGITPDGKDAVNNVTWLFLRATELLKLRDPNVNARYHHQVNADAYLERVSEVIAETKAIPAFHNDVTAISTLMNQGVSEAHARDYAIIGCVELGCAGRSYDAPSSIILNLIAPLELALYSGKRPITQDEQIGPVTPHPEEMSSFESFWEHFKTQLAFLINEAVELNNNFGLIHQKTMPSPLLSGLFDGPIDNGRDLIFGGARYNSSGATHVGFADTVDSLNAIEQAIFIDKKCTFNELLVALDKNFAGHDELHAYLVGKTPKYGTSHHVARKNAQNLISFLYQTYQSKSNYRGGTYRPAYWTMTNHAGLGQLAGALPNGRKAYRILASGITPVSQAAADLADCLDSVAALKSNEIPGSVAFNLKYSNLTTPEDRKSFSALVKTFFQKGGMQIQFNIMDYEMLIDAMEHADKYQDLIVRVSGYSAYFGDLTPAMKQEIVTRTAYDIKNKKAAAYPSAYKDLLPYE